MAEEKEKRKIDNDQRAAIESVRNSVVSAGAGSGKTTVLSQRFLHLIQTNHYDADKILTLTFTKKATVEMSDRIYKVLRSEAPEQAAIFHKANIKTLDGYCSSVAKVGSHFYGISPDFTSDEEKLAEQVKAQAYPFILKHRDNKGIKKIAGATRFDELSTELFVDPILENSTIAEPIDFEANFRLQTKEIAATWQDTVKRFDSAVNDLKLGVIEFEGNKSTKYQQVAVVFQNTELPETPGLSSDDVWNSNFADIETYLRSAKNFNELKKPGTLKGAEGWGEIIEEIKKHLSTLLSVYNCVAGFYIVKELIPLFQEFQEIVNDIKRITGFLTFKDISKMALCILRDHPEIRLQEKRKYKAIMIDEFQDNNSDQRDMLYLLAERESRMEKSVPDVSELCPDKLFFVGDEKQSIYRFRGADVSVFRKLAGEFSEGNLSMHTNYRSHPSLIAAFNTLFGGFPYPVSGKPAVADNMPSVFFSDANGADKNSDIPDYEAVYHEVMVPESKLKEINTPEKKNESYIPHVHFALYDVGADKEDPPDEKKFMTGEEAEVEWVTRKIEELINREENPVNPSDIAILLPKLSPHQPRFEKAFLRHGIPYNTEVATDIFADGPVNDITAFINLCVNPDDKCSYAQVLRSPFVNLSFEEMQKVLSRNAFSDDAADLFDEKNNEESEGRERFLRMAAFYRDLVETSAYEPLTTTVSRLWYDSGYRYETLWNHTVEMFGKQYDMLFELARQSDVQNLNIAAFADILNGYKNNPDDRLDDMDIPMEQADGVHIMSVHKSKGLEFDVVFVCGTGSGRSWECNKSFVFASKEYGITVNTPVVGELAEDKKNIFFEKAKLDTILRNNAENRRLAYVALTRAKNELYITNGKYKKEDFNKLYEKWCPGGENQIRTLFEPLSYILAFYMESQPEIVVSGCGKCAPFDVQFVPPFARNEISTHSGRKNSTEDRKKLLDFLRTTNPYENAEIIKAVAPGKKYTNPSHLHESDDESLKEDTLKGSYSFEIDKTIPYWEIGDIVLSTLPAKAEEGESLEPKFTFANFGTIAHAYMEAAVTGGEPVIKEKEFAGLENKKKSIEKIKSICEEMALKFKSSSLGAQVAECMSAQRFIKAEYSFRSRLKDSILKGTIDLVFENPDGTFTIVDYKTNQSVKPEIYYLQLACYRQAVAAMLGVKDASSIRCMLSYLRFGKVVDITEPCGKISVE